MTSFAAGVVAFFAAVAFILTLQFRVSLRTLAWLFCLVVVAMTPCAVPVGSPWRFVASLWAVGLLTKLYDLHWTGDISVKRGFLFHLTWLPNFFWLVLRRVPGTRSRRDDWRQLPLVLAQAVIGALLLAAAFWCDWSTWPFVVEHCAKVVATFATVVPFARVGAIAWRLAGGIALDPMLNPLTAATPAEFWRRWNRPAQSFFETYVYPPAGGRRHHIRATLVTFAVSGVVHEYVFGIAAGHLQGWQMLFFLIQGVAAATTSRLRLTGVRRVIGQFLNIGFNLLSSMLFFQSVNGVCPFYVPR